MKYNLLQKQTTMSTRRYRTGRPPQRTRDGEYTELTLPARKVFQPTSDSLFASEWTRVLVSKPSKFQRNVPLQNIPNLSESYGVVEYPAFDSATESSQKKDLSEQVLAWKRKHLQENCSLILSGERTSSARRFQPKQSPTRVGEASDYFSRFYE